MRRSTRLRLIAFMIIGGLAIINAGIHYAGLGNPLTSSSYEVTVRLAESGGLFDRAEVTYRGVTVGRVDDVRFRRDGVDAVLSIDNERQIPAALTAEVHNRSAVGEQFIDLIPSTDQPPYLADGDVIVQEATSTPIDENDLLASIDAFVTSVDTDDLTTVVDELGLAFDGVGEDLQRMIDGGSKLVQSAQEALPATRALISDGGTVLQTQADQSRLISGYLRDIAGVSGVLSDQDDDLRTILQDGASAARQLTLLADDLSPPLKALLADLVSISDIAYQRQDGIEETLVALPWALASAQTPGRDGRAHFGLAVAQLPDVCREGYIPSGQWRPPADLTFLPSPDWLGCAEGAPSVPRGSPAVIDAPTSSELRRSAASGGAGGADSWVNLFRLPPPAD